MVGNNKSQAFTLVELIIVITILALLATIAFISFQGYTKSSRDSNRVLSLTSIQKGLDNFQVLAGSIPQPDTQFGTGQFGSVTLTNVGYVGEGIARVINLKSIPKDPFTNISYMYGIDQTRTKYQIASTLENAQVSSVPHFSPVYADGPLKAKVIGNYLGLLKTNSAIYNIPSLISTNTGVFQLTGSVNYVVNNGQNLPYTFSRDGGVNFLTGGQVLQMVIQTGTSLSITGLTLPLTDWNIQGGDYARKLGYAPDYLGQIIYGDKYFSEIKSSPIKNCGSVSAEGYTYETIIALDGKCWTRQNMNHGTMLGAAVLTPTNINLTEKWCYNDLVSNCTQDGALYNWYEAMGLPSTASGTTTEDTSKSVCGKLSPGNWRLPSESDWNTLIASGATGWKGNQVSGIILRIPGVKAATSYLLQGDIAGRRSSKWGSYTNADTRSIASGYDTISTDSNSKAYMGASVVCVRY